MLLKVNGVELSYAVYGTGNAPWITFSHSLAANKDMWLPQIELLSKQYRILSYDIRGHGESPVSERAFTPMDLAQDVIGLLDALAIDKTHFVGLSLGGMIGQELALHFPQRLLSLVACNCRSDVPPAGVAGWMERVALVKSGGIEAIVEPTFARWFSEGFEQRDPSAAAAVRAMIGSTSADGYINAINALIQVSNRQRLNELTMPVLFIAGAQDMAAPAAEMRAMHASATGSQYCELNPAGHLSNIDNGAGFNEALSTFLAQVDSRETDVGKERAS